LIQESHITALAFPASNIVLSL